jgi:hypothetical protein
LFWPFGFFARISASIGIESHFFARFFALNNGGGDIEKGHQLSGGLFASLHQINPWELRLRIAPSVWFGISNLATFSDFG